MDELRRALKYSKIKKIYGLKDKEIDNYIKGLLRVSELVNPKEKLHVVKEDPEDNKFLEAVEASGADFIVTGDKHLLNMKKYRNTEIVTPTMFLKEIKGF